MLILLVETRWWGWWWSRRRSCSVSGLSDNPTCPRPWRRKRGDRGAISSTRESEPATAMWAESCTKENTTLRDTSGIYPRVSPFEYQKFKFGWWSWGWTSIFRWCAGIHSRLQVDPVKLAASNTFEARILRARCEHPLRGFHFARHLRESYNRTHIRTIVSKPDLLFPISRGWLWDIEEIKSERERPWR